MPNNTEIAALLQAAARAHVAGQDPFPLKQQAARLILERFAASNVKGVQIIRQKSACPVCQAIADRFYTIAEALQIRPIPCRLCRFAITKTEPFGFCRCMYVAARVPGARPEMKHHAPIRHPPILTPGPEPGIMPSPARPEGSEPPR